MAQHDESSAATPAGPLLDRVALRRIIDAVRQPAFLISDTGRLLYRNAAAREQFDRIPTWLAVCAVPRSAGVPQWVRCVVVDPATVLVLADAGAVGPDDAVETPWARRWGLPPRLARVAACLACGLTDKEIAVRLGLGYQTVRTYVKQVYGRTRLRSRAEIVRAVHTGVARR